MSKTYPEHITKEELALCPQHQYNGPIKIITSVEDLNDIIPELLKEDFVGFDTETKPSFKKGKTNKVALLQLSTAKMVYLIRIQKTKIPNSLTKLLSSESTLKIGAAVRDDIKELQALRRFEAKGFIDLQNYVEKYGILDKSVKKLTAIILGFRISKSQQLTNWEQDILTEPQQIYAATDAWVCYEMYKKLTT